jgi:hypothetical protein
LNRFRCLELKHVEKPFCLNCKESWQAWHARSAWYGWRR